MSISRIETTKDRTEARKKAKDDLAKLGASVTEGAKKTWKDLAKLVNSTDKKKLAALMPVVGLAIGFLVFGGKKTEKSKKKEAQATKPKFSTAAGAALAEKVGTPEREEEPLMLYDPAQTQSNSCETAIKKDRDGNPIINEKTGEPEKITLCSLTGKKNIQMLLEEAGVIDQKIFKSIRSKHAEEDIQKIIDEAAAGEYNIEDVVPTGNADDVQQFYLRTAKTIIRMGDVSRQLEELNGSGKTVCDIMTFGSTRYDHRAVGFKGTDGNWYVLDPYRTKLSTKPVRYEEYIEKHGADIAFLVPIDTRKK